MHPVRVIFPPLQAGFEFEDPPKRGVVGSRELPRYSHDTAYHDTKLS